MLKKSEKKNPPKGGFLFVNMTDHSRTDTKVISALALVHFIGDFYVSFVNPLFPVFVERFSLTLTQVGLIAGISRLLAFIVQPSVGYLADHYRTRFFVLGGPLLAIVFISLVGIAPSFLLLVLFVSLGSIGSSMFHPTTAGMVSTYGGQHFGFSMAIFNLGGTLAFGVGPLFITYMVGSYGLEVSPVTMIFGLAVMALLFRIVPLPQGEGLKNLGFVGSLEEALGTVWKPIMVIWVAMAQELAPRGRSMVSSLIMGLAFGAGGMMTPLTGKLADFYSLRAVLAAVAIVPLLTVGLISFLPEKKLKYEHSVA